MRLAYADPPYPGQARKHYAHDPRCAEVDHVDLFARLAEYDGWALSTGADLAALQYVIPLVPAGARVGAWVKPFASFKPGVNPGYTWEPVIFRCARPGRRDVPTVRDHLAANITLRKGLSGAKPDEFCRWLFDLLGAEPGDTLDDLYPGTGGVSATWERWSAVPGLFMPRRREAESA